MIVSKDLKLFLDDVQLGRVSNNVIFLGCPYSSDDPAVVAERVDIASRVTVELLSRGHIVVSPLPLSHPLAKHGTPKGGWYKYCLELLKLCNSLWVLQLDGWDVSEGVRLELSAAYVRGMDIRYINRETIDLWLRPGSAEQVDDIPF